MLISEEKQCAQQVSTKMNQIMEHLKGEILWVQYY